MDLVQLLPRTIPQEGAMDNASGTSKTLISDTVRENLNRPGETNRLRDSIDNLGNDVRRTKRDVSQNRQDYDSHVRNTRVLWVISVLVVAGLGMLVWWARPLLNENTQLLATISGMYSTVEGLTGRVQSIEEKISTWANERLDLSNRIDKVEKTVAAGFANKPRDEARVPLLQAKQEMADRFNAV